MSYTDALARVSELRERLHLPARVRTIGDSGFDQVLATARSRFEQGPARIITGSSEVDQGQWGNGTNVVAARARIGGARGAASAAIGSPGFATPARVNGWSPEMKRMADAAAERFGVPRELVIAVSRAESAFRSDAGSPAGARGLMQLMPGTARGLGVTDITDPWQNLAGGTKYLRQMLDRFDGDVHKALAGYNAGPGNVDKYGGVPPFAETRTYVARVLDYAAELGFSPGAPTRNAGNAAA